MKIRSEGDIDELVLGAQLLAIVAAWDELGLWRALAERGQPSRLAELSEGWPGGTRGLEVTVPILAHAGLLEGGGQTWDLTPDAREMYERGQLEVMFQLGRLDDLSRLPQTLREGGPARSAEGESRLTRGGVAPDPDKARHFMDMLYRRSEAAARRVIAWARPRAKAGGHVLDLGGGHGRYGRAFLDEGMRVTLFDQPPVIELARERHGDALAYVAGDFHQDDLGGPYDLAFLSNIVHCESADGNVALMARLFEALSPGGLLVIKDMFIDDQGSDPERAVFFGMIVLSYTAHGQSYTLGDMASWTGAAGFEAIEHVSGDGHTLVFAKKPG